MLTVPGNHDSRNVGYLHFEDLIGPRMWSHDVEGVRIVGVDSSEPDLNEGKVGRVHYDWIRRQFEEPAQLKVFVLHHHLLPIPGTGRERSTVMDAGDLLEVLIHAGVQVVLSGHKHVPYVWRLEDMYVANAGTVSSLRVRGYTKPCYNVLEFDDGQVRILRRFPFGESHVMTHFSLAATSSTGSTSCPSRSARCPSATSEHVRAPRSSPLARGGVPPMRTVVLVDGEHYPPVTRWAIETAIAPWPRGRGRRCSSAASRRSTRDRCPTSACRRAAAGQPIAWPRLADAIERWTPEVVLDLSDEPVLGYRERMELAAVALDPRRPLRRARTSELEPAAARRRRSPAPDARRDRHGQANREDRDQRRGGAARRREAGLDPVVVAMGRGGPPSRRWRRRAACTSIACSSSFATGQHAASDYLEDALTTGVTTIGARRAGGGLAGAAVRDELPEAAPSWPPTPSRVSSMLEGSGAAVPPVPWDAGVLVVPAGVPARVPRRATSAPIGCCGRTWWLLPWQPARSPGPRTSPHCAPTSSGSCDESQLLVTDFVPVPLGGRTGCAGVLRHHRSRRRRCSAGRASARRRTDARWWGGAHGWPIGPASRRISTQPKDTTSSSRS